MGFFRFSSDACETSKATVIRKYSKKPRFSYKEGTHIGSSSYAFPKSVRVTKTLVQRCSSQVFASGNPYAFGKLGGKTKLWEKRWKYGKVVLLFRLCANTSSLLEKTAIRKYSKKLRFSYKEHCMFVFVYIRNIMTKDDNCGKRK